MSEKPAVETQATTSPGGVLLKGTPVAPGLALGAVHRKDYDLLKVHHQRVPLEGIEAELNRFHSALGASRQQLEALKSKLQGKVPSNHVRILDTHVAYLKDSVFLSDVENLILNEQMALEAAIAKVIADFDRIFRLVENETLRERAVDLRDVGIRVLRNIERDSADEDETPTPLQDYVLIARELSIVDMFNLENEHVLGIVTEEGGLTSHAAILARSMQIPTLTGVQGLLETVHESDFVIVDATEGSVRVNPDEVIKAQYLQARSDSDDALALEAQSAKSINRPIATADGESVQVSAVCANLPEVGQAAEAGMRGVGLYRTELLYLIDRVQPSVDSLIAHYSSVVELAGAYPVTFRLLDVDSSLDVSYLHDQREQNPGLGRSGVRVLLTKEQVLRNQLQAILRASCPSKSLGSESKPPRSRIAIPFVTDCGELRRVREILYEERLSLRKTGVPHMEKTELGIVVETPAAILGIRDLVAEADFLVISLDSLLQYLLAADRENHDLRHYFDALHPVVLRTLREVVTACRDADRALSIFGVSAVSRSVLPFLLGIGLRDFCVSPVGVSEFLELVRGVNVSEARHAAEQAATASCPEELSPTAWAGHVRRVRL